MDNLTDPIVLKDVELWRPRRDDISWMADLRNRDVIRSWFHNTDYIKTDDSERWLAERMTDDEDAILVLRVKGFDLGLGTIGWKLSQPEPRIYDVGRLVLDTSRLRSLRKHSSETLNWARLTYYACCAVQHHLFERKLAHSLTVSCKEANFRARKVAERAGAQTISVKDGCVNYVVTRRRWLERSEA